MEPQRVSLLSSTLFGCLGWIGPVVGWLLDRTTVSTVSPDNAFCAATSCTVTRTLRALRRLSVI